MRGLEKAHFKTGLTFLVRCLNSFIKPCGFLKYPSDYSQSNVLGHIVTSEPRSEYAATVTHGAEFSS